MKHLLFSCRRKSCLNSKSGSTETLQSGFVGGVGIKHLLLYNANDWLFQQVDPILPKEMGILSFVEQGAKATTSSTKQNGFAALRDVGLACKNISSFSLARPSSKCSSPTVQVLLLGRFCFLNQKVSCWVPTHHFLQIFQLPEDRRLKVQANLSRQGLVLAFSTFYTKQPLELWLVRVALHCSQLHISYSPHHKGLSQDGSASD